MSKFQSKVTLSDKYFDAQGMKQCIESVNRLTTSDVRILLYIIRAVSENYYDYVLYEEEDVHNLLLLELNKYSHDLDYYFNRLIEIKSTHTVPLMYFNWVLNDLRSAIYLAVKLLPNGCIPTLTKNNYIDLIKLVCKVNFLSMDSNNNFRFIPINFNEETEEVFYTNNISSYKIYYFRQRVKNEKIKWIDKSDNEQIVFLFNYLLSRNKLILINSFTPINNEEKYEQILASIDLIPDLPSSKNYFLPLKNKSGEIIRKDVSSVREYYLNAMKNAWNGRVYRKEKLIEKSECQVSIAKGNFAKLSELSKLYNKSPNKLINEWIVKEHEVAVGDL